MRALPSGKFVLRVSPETHARLKKEAAAAGISLNEQCKRLVRSGSASPSPPPHVNRHEEQWSALLTGSLADLIAQWKDEGLLGIVLFGSVARGQNHDHSDVDLLFVFPEERKVSRDLYHAWDERVAQLDWPFAERVSPHFVMLPRNWSQVGSLWYEVAVSGEILWEKKRNIRDLLAKLRGAMAEGKFQRRTAHGQPYWINHLAEGDFA